MRSNLKVLARLVNFTLIKISRNCHKSCNTYAIWFGLNIGFKGTWSSILWMQWFPCVISVSSMDLVFCLWHKHFMNHMIQRQSQMSSSQKCVMALHQEGAECYQPTRQSLVRYMCCLIVCRQIIAFCYRNYIICICKQMSRCQGSWQ